MVSDVGVGVCGAEVGRIGERASVVYSDGYLNTLSAFLLTIKQISSWVFVFGVKIE